MPKSSTVPVYDRNLAIRIAGGHPSVAAELLALLIQDLPLQTEALNQAYTGGNLEELRQLAHRLHGSASYCGTPALKRAAETLESVLLEAKTDSLCESYAQVLAEIDRLMEFCET